MSKNVDYDEMFGILRKFPKIRLTLAHFGFMSRLLTSIATLDSLTAPVPV